MACGRGQRAVGELGEHISGVLGRVHKELGPEPAEEDEDGPPVIVPAGRAIGIDTLWYLAMFRRPLRGLRWVHAEVTS